MVYLHERDVSLTAAVVVIKKNNKVKKKTQNKPKIQNKNEASLVGQRFR